MSSLASSRRWYRPSPAAMFVLVTILTLVLTFSPSVPIWFKFGSCYLVLEITLWAFGVIWEAIFPPVTR
jgi:hypothetical protein